MLRDRLQTMTETTDVSQHPKLLAEIARDLAHSIRVLQSIHPLARYTCLMHVFEFTEKEEYIDIATYFGANIYAGPDFAHWLMDHDHLEQFH